MRTSRPSIFQPVKSQRLSDAAAAQIRNLIIEGQLQPGERLPSQRELMELLEVSRSSLREALRALEVVGLIQVTPGLGSFVSPLAAISAATGRWDQWLKEHPSEILGILEVAEGLDPQASALAASRAKEGEIDEIAAAVEKMQEAIDAEDVEAIIAADIAFHDSVCRASHNKFLVELNKSLSLTIEARRAAFVVPSLARQSLEAHRSVARAIRARDPTRARQAMHEHIKRSQAVALQMELDTSVQLRSVPVVSGSRPSTR